MVSSSHASPSSKPQHLALDRLVAEIARCLAGDRAELQKLAEAARRRLRGGKPADRLLDKLSHSMEQARARVEARAAATPACRFPDELPVCQRRDEIAAAIEAHQVVVLCGETGSGKTTQLPKICLALGRGVRGMVGHTQPRRIAARSVAARIAEELGQEVGGAVGYKVRFTDRTAAGTYIKLMTDGILLAETQGDPLLEAYDTLIIDEAHERSLNIDFMLGYLRRILPRRPDLKVIITSATIDPERFSRHFEDAPILTVSGRTYPVEVRYRPVAGDDEESRDRDLTGAILDAVDEVARIDRFGDVLIFLPGEREIRDTAEALRKHHPPGTEILPLFARLSAAEQQRVFKPHPGRRIVLATNVAETSLTVPGIRFVIDPGLARISRYSYRTKVQRLPIEAISQASANQRTGRCGRVSAGVCIRLYSEEDFQGRPAFTEPEILRANLAAVILQMRHLGLGDIESFPFVEPPDPRYVRDGERLLGELGALDDEGVLTPLGRKLARLPVDPRIGRMLIEAERERSLSEVLVIAAALTIRDPRERPLEAQQKADEAHEAFRDDRSDFLIYLKLWHWFEAQRRHLSQNKLRKRCRECYLSYIRLREWRDVYQQLHHLVSDLGMRPNDQEADYAAIHRALLAGLLGNIALKDERNRYHGARGTTLHLWPGSGLADRGPKWLMAAELVETSRLYARTVAAIEPAWVERLAGPRLKRSYFEPHWQKRSARVAAWEQVSLYGLVLVPKRRVGYGPIDPVLARQLFIRHALVQGEYATRAPFQRHNGELIRDVEAIEHRERRRDVLVDEQEIFAFFDARVPAEVYDGTRFERWREAAESADPQLLFLTREALMRRPEASGADDYPARLEVAPGLTLPLEYHFDPARHCDGVTVTVPAAALNQLDPARLSWLVPGLLQEKATALIRGLPKALRRNFVPAPDFAAAALQAVPVGEGALTTALGCQLQRMSGVEVPAEAWRETALPDHLRLNIRVVDGGGEELAAGRDLPALQARLAGQAQAHFEAMPDTGWERDDVTAWDFGDLPDQVEVAHHGVTLTAIPALVTEGRGVALRLVDSPERARRLHREGLKRLILLALPGEVRYLERNLPGFRDMALHYAPVGRADLLRDDLVGAAVEAAFLADAGEVRSEAAYSALLAQGQGRLVAAANEICAAVGNALSAFHRVSKRLKGAVAPPLLPAMQDIRGQLDGLVYPGFVGATPRGWLAHYPRYLKAIEIRLDRLQGALERDRRHVLEVMRHWQRYRARVAGDGDNPQLVHYRWMIEELRVSLFAQELGTAEPVSPKRLDAEWARLQ